jgi:antitoxin VapB
VAFHVRDSDTDAVVRKLAKRKNKTLTETVREACEHEYEREYGEADFLKFVERLQKKYAALGELTGLAADKAFFDELSGEDELTGIL